MNTPVLSKSLRSALFPRNPNLHLPDLETFEIGSKCQRDSEWITSNIRKYFLPTPGRTITHCGAIIFLRICNHPNESDAVAPICSRIGNGKIKWSAFGRIEFNIQAWMHLSETLFTHLGTTKCSTPFSWWCGDWTLLESLSLGGVGSFLNAIASPSSEWIQSVGKSNFEYNGFFYPGSMPKKSWWCLLTKLPRKKRKRSPSVGKCVYLGIGILMEIMIKIEEEKLKKIRCLRDRGWPPPPRIWAMLR